MKLQWLPFGLAPRRQKTGPLYGDLYPRAVASGIDLTLLFLILNDFFHYVTAKFYARIDTDIFYQIKTSHHVTEQLQLAWDSGFVTQWLLNAVFQLVLMGVLYVSVQIIWGTTPGKWLLGLKIVRAHTFAPVERWRYPLRFLAYIVAALPLMIGIFWVGFSKERRGWHDRIAGTAVLNIRPNGWYWAYVKKVYYRLRGKPMPVPEPVVAGAVPGNEPGATRDDKISADTV